MPQSTNLNVSPYFDDFNAANDFHKVLFKPGFPVQARELTSSQSILQNQIEKLGQHFFKEGAKIVPGNTTYERAYTGIQLNNSFQGVPVAAYANQLIGTKITGQISGVTAYVKNIILGSNSQNGNLIFYVDYISSSTVNNSTAEFSDGEELTCNTTITSGLLGNSTIPIGTPFASTIQSGSAITGTAFSIEEGVYFLHGNFVNIGTETLVLDQFTTLSNYRVGLNINEEIITSDLDESLNDNSQGYNNFAAPGADRLKITASLFKKPLDDFNDTNFVELATIITGNLRGPEPTAASPFKKELKDTMAKRSFETSGDYTIQPFDTSAKDSLNDNEGNDGLYDRQTFTAQGNIPTEDTFVYKVSEGVAFVKGYEVRKVRPTLIDVPKPRTTLTIDDESITYNTGPTLRLNRVFGTPGITTAHNTVVSLRDSRIGAGNTIAAGNEIGVARIYDFSLESGSYNVTSNINEWDISLYDVQTTTEITLNQQSTFTTPTYIRGVNSGATGFLFKPVTDNATIEVYETNGDFIKNEPIAVNGNLSGKIAIAVTSHTISDVKSVFSTRDVGSTPYTGTVGLSSIFNADVVQSVAVNIGIATISAASGGFSTITSPNQRFPGDLVKVGNLIQFSNSAKSNDPTYGKVTAVGTDTVTVANVADVDGIVNGDLPTTIFDAQDLKVLTTDITSSSDNTLFTHLPKDNISNVDLTSASLSIRRAYTVNIVDGQTNIVNAGENEVYLPFDAERYSLIRTDGVTEVLTADKFIITNGGRTLQIGNLGSNSTNATLISTLTKRKPTSKTKIRNRVNSIIVDKSKLAGSGIGSTSLNNGLDYGNYPVGTRVEDEIISLNTPDVIQLHGIFESGNVSDPTAPKATLNTIVSPSGTTAEYVIGEKITGQTTNAVAVVANITTSSQIEFIYKNDGEFEEGETIISSESNVNAVITTIDESSFDITDRYSFVTGQESTQYNYGYILKDPNAAAPTKKIKIYFLSAYYDSNDTGDVTTADSYESFDYAKEIPFIDGIKNSNIIDIRPRVNEYTVTENVRSPLEFYGRSYDAAGNSAATILASRESLLTTFSHYVGRIDLIVLSKTGKIELITGVPSEDPQKPEIPDDSIEIATVDLPPFLASVEEEVTTVTENKLRYTMGDIRRLENRIKSLEYYTALSLLENDTSNFFVPDGDGLNRFKSGFFVDNFETFLAQDERYIKNSIDTKNKELRPSHYTTSVDLMFGPVVNVDATQDSTLAPIEGVNVRRNNGIVTLDYSEVEWLKQDFCTRSVSVTPYIVPFWNGVLMLTPQSDTWTDTVRLQARTIINGNFNEQVARARQILGRDPQIGFVNTAWDAWRTTWAGAVTTRRTADRWRTVRRGDFQNHERFWTTWTEQQQRRQRSGRTVLVTEQRTDVSMGERIISRDLVTFVRSRNIHFNAQGIKPLTRMYAFFGGREVSRFCVPKLLQITMSSGAFQPGETVIGRMNGGNRNGSAAYIQFRLSNPNHRDGAFNVPTNTFSDDPYTLSAIPSTYTSNSTLLNVDTASLADITQTDFFGWVASGMQLSGQTSGAQATISDLRLVSGLSGALMGSFFVPDPNNSTFPSFETGTNLFRLTSDAGNAESPTTDAELNYTASGMLNTVREDIISTRNATVTVGSVSQQGTITANLGGDEDFEVVQRVRVRRRSDPLAQSFWIDTEDGLFLTRCDVFFRTKDDDNIPLDFSIRTIENGLPTQVIVPMSEVVMNPDDVILSSDGSRPTTFQFQAPVYLEGGKEYCIVMLSNSAKYSVYISRVGEVDLITQSLVSQQPYLGSLFKSQNASTWEPSQWEDLKFTLYRADFIQSGSFDAYNPNLNVSNAQVAKLMPDSLTFTSKQIRVGLSKTISDEGLELGNTVLQGGTQATADFVGSAGTITSIDITNAGLGYTPAASALTFSGVNLVTLTGKGRNATADITISNGSIVASGATIVDGGQGYQLGDVVGISTIGANSIGRNAKLSVTSIGSTSELILDNVEGNFIVGSANTLSYINNTGITTVLDDANGGNVQISTLVDVSDGLHIKVNHKNHGMYSTNNIVEISHAESDIIPSRLTTALETGNESQISVGDASQFTTFEGVGVGTTNVGYAMLGDEIISYTNVSGNVLGNISRGVSGSGEVGGGVAIANHPVGTPVVKYELNGVNLMRINKQHDVVDDINFDYYNVKLDMSQKFNTENDDRSNDLGYPQLFIGETKSAGGNKTQATQNIPFEIITPIIQNVTLPRTGITASARTITGTSLGGNEVSFLDNGFEAIVPNNSNYLNTPRLIASNINSTNSLNTLPGNKSLDVRFTLNTSNSFLSPVLDGERMSVILTSNRVNTPITNYIDNAQVKTIDDDPNACQYISKEMELENSASSLKIILDAHINVNTDIRAFYSINLQSNMDPVFVPFPGYTNLDSEGQMISFENSDGLPDKFITKSNEYGHDAQDLDYTEYTFTGDQLPSFRYYRIKLVLTATTQVHVPRIRRLRVMALA